MNLNEAKSILRKNGIKLIKESEMSLVDSVYQKYQKWEAVKNTPEGDDLWDALVAEYDYDLITICTDYYDEIKTGKPVDMTWYLTSADGLYDKFFKLLSSVGVKKITINTREAFDGRAEYFYQMLIEGGVTLDLKTYDGMHPNIATLNVVR